MLCFALNPRTSSYLLEARTALFPDSFHQQLRDLLVTAIAQIVDSSTETDSKGLSSMPSLISSRCLIRGAPGDEPILALDLELNRDEGPSEVTLILTPETVGEMVTGMSRIRDQLFAAATKK